MSYNIDNWTQIACSLTFPASLLGEEYAIIADVRYDRPEADGSAKVTIELDMEMGEIVGVLMGDTATVERIDFRGEGSGRASEDLHALLEHTQGHYQALLVWEGGDSISLLTVNDGEVDDSNIDVAELVRENAELKERIAELEK